MIFVDETLLQIDDKDYWWLWIAYELALNICLMMYIYLEKEHFHMLPVLQAIKD
jgi:hypothetical protein